ncbi:hypothetical protein V6Z11_A07G072600 [Gossypium hirsutum]
MFPAAIRKVAEQTCLLEITLPSQGCRSQVLNQHPKPDPTSANFW